MDLSHHSAAGRVRQRDVGERLVVYSGNTGMWGPFSVDAELETVYMPIELSTGDYYGGHRPGSNLFTESLVAVDLYTGKRKWHFQFVHHGIWDFDLPCAPILADVTIDGKPRKIAAVPSKQGFLYVFDRQTGQPVWPIVEKPVEKGTVPGEWYSPTQPFPTKPPPFELQGVQEKDLIDFTPELLAEAKRLRRILSWVRCSLHPSLAAKVGRSGRRTSRTARTGPEAHRSGNGNPVCLSNTLTRLLILANDPKRSDMDFINTGGGGDTGVGGGVAPGCNLMPCAITVQGLPFVKPPCGRITAIDLKTEKWCGRCRTVRPSTR